MTINQKIAELVSESEKLADLQTEQVVEAAEEEQTEEVKEVQQVKVDVSEDVSALVNGEELSEEFKAKAATIFEAAVVTRVKQELARLEEEFDTRVNEQVEIVKEGLIEKVDGYLNYVVEQWMNDNELALEHGVKLEIFESFVSSMKGVFEQHNIELPEEKYDVVGELAEEVEQATAKLDEQVAANIVLVKELNEMKRQAAIKESVNGMSELDVEKFSSLVEELSYEDSNTFAAKLQTIKENYFGKKAAPAVVNSVVTDTPVELKEEVKPQQADPRMSAYLRALGK